MADISFFNYFGRQNDFENLKKWFRINSDLYKELLLIAKERYELEQEYAAKLSKLSGRLLKVFQLPIGSINNLWSNIANHFTAESEIHRRLGNQFQNDFLTPLTTCSDQFIKFKKPIEIDIDKNLKSMQEKREEETKCKKRAFCAMKDCEKMFETLDEYKRNHPASAPGNDKEKAKIVKRVQPLKDLSVKAEKEYFDSSLVAEETRQNWEQSFLAGVEQLQKLETDRLKNMKTIVENYQKIVDEVPGSYKDISLKIKADLQKANVNEDLVENSMYYTNKSPNVYKTEQVLLTLYSESKDNQMDMNRRIENLEKGICALHQEQKKYDNMRTGALKMMTIYETSPQFSDDSTRRKTKREYSKSQCMVNLLSANIYKLLKALTNWHNKPIPPDPLQSLGMKILLVVDRNSLLTSTLESNPGQILPICDPGVMSRSNSSNSGRCLSGSNTVDNDDDDDDFDDSSEEEAPEIPRQATSVQKYTSKINKSNSVTRPLPPLPKSQNKEIKCKARHDFNGRDNEELSFKQGDLIIVKRKINDIWWEGELKGRIGLIPRNYVNEV